MNHSHPTFDASSRRNHLIATLCLAVFCMVASVAVHADSEVVRQHDIDASGVRSVDVNAAVGSIRIRQGSGDVIRVRLEIKGSRSGILRRRADVSDMDLEVTRSGSELKLEFQQDNAAADWEIELPRSLDLALRLGVGELDADLAGGNLDIKVGVGEVELRLPKTAAAQFSATTGVGEARIRGGDNAEQTRTFVSGRASSEGSGSAQVAVKVGVGEIDIRLR